MADSKDKKTETPRTILRATTAEVDKDQRAAEEAALKDGLERFLFPEHGLTVIAVDRPTAEAEVIKHLEAQKQEEGSSND